MLSFGVFGITNDSLNQAVSVLLLVLIVIWAALVHSAEAFRAPRSPIRSATR